MHQKVPLERLLGAACVTDLCTLRDGPPPFSFKADMGLSEPLHDPRAFYHEPKIADKTTFWQEHHR